jgi:hypothetical protein
MGIRIELKRLLFELLGFANDETEIPQRLPYGLRITPQLSAFSSLSENSYRMTTGTYIGWLGSNEVSPQTLRFLGDRKTSTPATHHEHKF